MILTISKKLNIAFVGLTIAALAATLGLARWSFNQGFLDYVNAREQSRLQLAQEALAREYQAAGNSWEGITNRGLGQLIHQSSMEDRPAPRPAAAGFNGAPPRHAPPGDRRPPDARPRYNGGGVNDIVRSGAPTALYDSENNLIAGLKLEQDRAHLMRFPIVVDGVTVGELRSEPRTEFGSPSETAFSRQQLATSWLIGIACLIVAIGISLFLSRHFLGPVKRMFQDIQKLSRGDYSLRAEDTGKDELGQLGRDINHLGKTLRDTQQARQRLFADISHELRTPLTVLSGEIEALKDGLREFDTVQLESLDHEVQRLRHLVDDLYQLSVSDIGGLKYEFAPLALDELISSSINSIRNIAADRGISVSTDVAAADFAGDKKRLQQLFANLLTNSLTYTDTPGKIHIELSPVNEMACITIEDSAPGVPQAQCEQLFDPLFRVEVSRSRRTGGAGLGLAICRNIAAAHGGNISAAPSSLGGLRVTINFPLAIENPP